ncbi:MAG: hypothetical protein L3K26_10560, partial [Candidatus Hydrogenedentes bacterium]|nr:hypothetical protein [Candidatus Hydrogenedentota bacterium]
MKIVAILFACLFLSLFSPLSWAEVLERGAFIIDFHPDDRSAAEDTLTYLEEAQADFADKLPLGVEPIRVRIASN